MVERVSEKHEVTGSSPVPGTSMRTQFFALREGCVLCICGYCGGVDYWPGKIALTLSGN